MEQYCIIQLLAPFIFALIIFILTQIQEHKRWHNETFLRRKQNVYVAYFEKLLDIKSNLEYLISPIFTYNILESSNFGEETSEESVPFKDLNFEKARIHIAENLNDIICVFKEYYFAYQKFSTYLKKVKIKNLNRKKFDFFCSGLGTLEGFILDLQSICITKNQNNSEYYYTLGDFESRLYKISCTTKSVLKALDESNLIEYLEEKIIIEE